MRFGTSKIVVMVGISFVLALWMGGCDDGGKECTPKTCEDYAGQCGSALDDGCGGTLDCSGACGGGQVCYDGSCCTPKTCGDYAGQCGSALDDGCGGTLDCSGACGDGEECNQGQCRPVTRWALGFGGSQWDWIYSLSGDGPSGGYAAGYYYSPDIDTGQGVWPQAGNEDAYLVRFDGDGNIAWAMTWGGSGREEAFLSPVLADGTVYVALNYDSPDLTVDGSSVVHEGDEYSYDLLLLKVGADGSVRWTRSIRSPGNEWLDIHTMALAPGDGVYVLGHMLDSTALDLGTGVLPYHGSNDFFLARLDTDGSVVWARAFGGSRSDEARVTSDSDGNVYLAGSFDSTDLDLGTGPLPNSGDVDFFVAKLDADGNLLWARAFGGPGREYASDVAVSSDGTIYVVCNVRDTTMTFAGAQLSSQGGDDVLLVALDGDGGELWARMIGGSGSELAFDVEVTDGGEVLVGGGTDSTDLSMGSMTLASAGNYDVLILRFTAAGEPVWGELIGGRDTEGAGFLSPLQDGHFYVGGIFFTHNLEAGPAVLTNRGSSDVFVVKY